MVDIKVLINAIWENPQPAFNCDFRRGDRYLENLPSAEYNKRGKIRLQRNDKTIYVHYNGDSRSSGNVIDYLTDVLNKGNKRETIIYLAKLYNIPLVLTEAQQKQYNCEELAKEITPHLVRSLQVNPKGVAALYLTEQRGLKINSKEFGELTPEIIPEIKQHLKNRDISYKDEYFKYLGITAENARKGYNVVIPIYINGNVSSFIFRNTRADATKGERYRYSSGLEQRGYYQRLQRGNNIILVEGHFDAIRLNQAGINNVIAMGGAELPAELYTVINSYNPPEIIYIPDLQYNERGERTGNRNLTINAINKILSQKGNIQSLRVVEIPLPTGIDLKNYKEDIDSWGKGKTREELEELINNSVYWWEWRLQELFNWGVEVENKGRNINQTEFINHFNNIYTSSNNPYDRGAIKEYIRSNETANKILTAFGITPEVLTDIDRNIKNTLYNNHIKEVAKELTAASEKECNPVTINRIVNKLNDIQNIDTREEWDKEINKTFEDVIKDIVNAPDTIKTKWELGGINKKEWRKLSTVEFYPADITVFCAATSHGKTMFLINTAFELLNKTDKKILYISCEENKRQLTERALNHYINIPTTKTGYTEDNKYCFIEQTRRKTIKAVIKGLPPVEEYKNNCTQDSNHYRELEELIKTEIQNYRKTIAPNLVFIHTEDSTESICNNITNTVEEYNRYGVEVGAVLVDYMQLLTSNSKTSQRNEELKSICKALHDCALKCELPIIVAAQLNRESYKNGNIDNITAANIGESADIERIAHDIYLLWQTDKTLLTPYMTSNAEENIIDTKKLGWRSKRIFKTTKDYIGAKSTELRNGYLYVEHLKARDGLAGGWGLFPYQGERGYIGVNDVEAIKKELENEK